MNAFENLADQQISAPRKARLRATGKRSERKTAERQAAEREQLSAAWRRWHNERRKELLAGLYGDSFRSLIDFLENATLESGAALIAKVEAAPWRYAGTDVRLEALTLIDRAVIGLRERNGLPPFDDPLPGDPPNVFQVIREALS